MREIKLGDTPTAGDAFYLPIRSESTYVNPPSTELREDGYLLIIFGPKRVGDIYLDIDANGLADPVTDFIVSGPLGGGRGVTWELPEQALARHGYTRSLSEPLPDE